MQTSGWFSAIVTPRRKLRRNSRTPMQQRSAIRWRSDLGRIDASRRISTARSLDMRESDRRLSQNKYRAVPRYASGWVYLYPVHVASVTLLKMASYGEG